MRRAVAGDAARAALYVLGALPAEEAAAFEARLRTSAALRGEVESLRAATGELGLAAEPAAPRPAVRARVLERVRESRKRPATPDLLFALHDQGEWIAIGPGLEGRELHRQGRSASYLLRLAPGTAIPRHEHRVVEHSYVLSGSLDVDGQLCRAGDYHRAAPGTVHHAAFSADGCVVLVIAESAA